MPVKQKRTTLVLEYHFSILSDDTRPYHVGTIPSRLAEIQHHASHQKLFNVKQVHIQNFLVIYSQIMK